MVQLHKQRGELSSFRSLLTVGLSWFKTGLFIHLSMFSRWSSRCFSPRAPLCADCGSGAAQGNPGAMLREAYQSDSTCINHNDIIIWLYENYMKIIWKLYAYQIISGYIRHITPETARFSPFAKSLAPNSPKFLAVLPSLRAEIVVSVTVSCLQPSNANRGG